MSRWADSTDDEDDYLNDGEHEIAMAKTRRSPKKGAATDNMAASGKSDTAGDTTPVLDDTDTTEKPNVYQLLLDRAKEDDGIIDIRVAVIGNVW